MASLKYTFDKNAAEYRRFRPTYPVTLADDIVNWSGLQKGARILEVGCGAGQATMLFSDLKPTQTSIDIGASLMRECRDRYASISNYQFVCSSLEDFDGATGSYDLIYAATCFHWLTPSVRFSKSCAMLKTNGHLAVFSDKHYKNRDGFFEEVQRCYEKHAPQLAMKAPRPVSAPAKPEENPLNKVVNNEYDRDISYTAEEYVGLLKTVSDHIALGDERLKTLCDSIYELIADRYRGAVVKTLTTRLDLYKKV